MPIFNNILAGASGQATGYDIDQSLRFNNPDGAYLTFTPSSTATSTKIFTFSGWVKRGQVDQERRIFTAGEAGSTPRTDFTFGSTGALSIGVNPTGSAWYMATTTALYRDPSAWYHIVWSMDTSQASASNRSTLYVNGEQVTDFSSNTLNDSTAIPQDSTVLMGQSGMLQAIGAYANNLAQSIYDGYLAEVHFIDGQKLTPASFGETNSATNQWVPIEVTGLTYGTNGFYLPFSATELANSFSNDTNSDAFVPSANLTVNYIVVAGGGSGGAGDSGNYGGGGGGAGGLLSGSTSVTSGTSYPITVGAGGAAIAPSASSGSKGNDGSNSIFSSFTAIGGGGGGFMSTGGNDGGSGGGGAGGGGGGGDGTSGQGNDGGDHDNYLGAGGGGAGGAGQTRSGTTGGVGGAGADHSGTFGTGYGVSGLFAGGGGGGYTTGGGQGTAAGAGGSGGGGAGGAVDGTAGATTPGTAGTANTGGGGGGGSAYHSGSTSSSDGGSGAGGSGVVLIRYEGSSPQATGGTISTVNISGTDYQVHAFTNVYNDHTITANGDVTNTRAQKKVGSSSIKFDGTGDFLTSPHSSDWGFGTGEFTLEMWIRFANKKTGSGAAGANALLANHDSPDGWQWIYRGSDNTFEFWSTDQDEYSSSSITLNNDTWYHVAVTRDGNTLRHYVGGVQYGTNAFTETMSDTSTTLQIGAYDASGLGVIDGYMDEIRISDTCRYPDGTTFTPSTTAFTADSNTKLLIHSNFDGGLGADSSGNTNDFTVTNLVASDQVLDSPTNNFPTLNPLHWGIRNAADSVPLSEGNLKFTGSDSTSVYGTWYSTFEVPSSSGWYFEMVPTAIGSAEKQSQSLDAGGIRFKANGETNSGSYGSAWTAGDIIGVAINSSGAWFSINNTWQNSGNPATGSNAAGTPSLPGTILTGDGSATTNSSLSGVLNFGQDSSFAGNKTAQGNTDGNGKGDFYYTPPSGFVALCADNLPDPSIADPTAHFDTTLVSGNGSNRSITGLNFQPDFLWGKSRTNTLNHYLTDSVRGVNSQLYSDGTGSQGTETVIYTAFNSDGFSLGTGDMNTSGQNYAHWAWKGGGTASTNEDGSIDSSVSANTTAGFSIVNWNGTEASATVGHGLSQAPELIIVKDVDSARGWPSNIENITGTSNQYLLLNDTDSAATSSAYWGGTPGASVFTVGDSANTNDDASMIAYCFHSVEGYSKIGKYTGNGATDGPFIYTGFRPAFIMVKLVSAADGYWVMFDNKRDPDNPTGKVFYANLNAADTDVSSYTPYDLLSNGFKSRIPGGNGNEASYNSSGQTYIYLAFAESPFKYSNAR